MSTFDLLKQLKVLYIEDDPLTAEHFTMLLEHYSLKVTQVDNALEALKLFKSTDFQLLITDIVLEGMSGLELCHEIRSFDKQIPLVITSNFDDKDKLLDAVSLQLIDYLVKPVSNIQLKNTLEHVIQWFRDKEMLEIKLNEICTYLPFQKTLIVGNTSSQLTTKESQLMDLLIRHQSRLVTREHIEKYIYKDQDLSDGAYKNLIYRLRKKVGKETIITISGIGILLHQKDKPLERYT